MDSERQSVTLELFIYGSAEQPMSVHILHQEVPVIRQIVAELLANVLSYLVFKLKLRRECLYLLCKSPSLSYFEPLATFRGHGLFADCNYQSMLVIYSEADVNAFPDLQKYVENLFLSKFKVDIPIVEPPEQSVPNISVHGASMLDKHLSQSRSLLSQRVITQRLTSLQRPCVLTDNIAVEGKEMTADHQPVFCQAPDTLPFSYARGKLKPKDKLPSPCYFTHDFFVLHHNQVQQLFPEDVHRGLYELNKHNEMVMINKDIIRATKGVLPDIIRQAAYLLFTGQGLFKIQLPIRLFETRSQGHMFSQFFSNLHHLHLAAQAPRSLEMFKHVITFAVSSFLYKPYLRKPFNPLMGETFQGTFTDGSQMYVEHVAHEPPEEAILLVNEQSGFRVHSVMQFHPTLSGLEFRMVFKNLVHVDIHGERISFNFPFVTFKGALSADRRLHIEGTMYFHYPAKNWKAYVHFGSPGPIGSVSGLICINDNVLDGNQSALGSNLFGNIHKISQPKDQVLSRIEGSWLTHLNFDGVEYWNKSRPSCALHVGTDVLPSDWRFREDLNWYIRGNHELASAWKLKLEEVQREAQKARAQFAKRKMGRNK